MLFRVFREPQAEGGAKTLNQLRVEKYLDTSHFRYLLLSPHTSGTLALNFRYFSFTLQLLNPLTKGT